MKSREVIAAPAAGKITSRDGRRRTVAGQLRASAIQADDLQLCARAIDSGGEFIRAAGRCENVPRYRVVKTSTGIERHDRLAAGKMEKAV